MADRHRSCCPTGDLMWPKSMLLKSEVLNCTKHDIHFIMMCWHNLNIQNLDTAIIAFFSYKKQMFWLPFVCFFFFAEMWTHPFGMIQMSSCLKFSVSDLLVTCYICRNKVMCGTSSSGHHDFGYFVVNLILDYYFFFSWFIVFSWEMFFC